MKSIPVSGQPTSVAITPDGRFVYVTTAEPTHVLVVDTTSDEVVQGIDVPLTPGAGGIEIPLLIDIRITPEGDLAFVTQQFEILPFGAGCRSDYMPDELPCDDGLFCTEGYAGP